MQRTTRERRAVSSSRPLALGPRGGRPAACYKWNGSGVACLRVWVELGRAPCQFVRPLENAQRTNKLTRRAEKRGLSQLGQELLFVRWKTPSSNCRFKKTDRKKQPSRSPRTEREGGRSNAVRRANSDSRHTQQESLLAAARGGILGEAGSGPTHTITNRVQLFAIDHRNSRAQGE